MGRGSPWASWASQSGRECGGCLNTLSPRSTCPSTLHLWARDTGQDLGGSLFKLLVWEGAQRQFKQPPFLIYLSRHPMVVGILGKRFLEGDYGKCLPLTAAAGLREHLKIPSHCVFISPVSLLRELAGETCLHASPLRLSFPSRPATSTGYPNSRLAGNETAQR